MEVDGRRGADATEADGDVEQAPTPDKSDLDATEDDADASDTTSHFQPTKSGVGSKGKSIEIAKAEDNTRSREKASSPPPRRPLPFTERSTAKAHDNVKAPTGSVTQEKTDADESETEGATDDDEL